MRQLFGVAKAEEITVPLAALGQAAYAFLLSLRLKPAEILAVHPSLIGVQQADLQTAVVNLGDVNLWKRLVLKATPHACIVDLFEFGPDVVATWSMSPSVT